MTNSNNRQPRFYSVDRLAGLYPVFRLEYIQSLEQKMHKRNENHAS
jgi:hypothetical protein